jgi:opacity protein-like surface antigen
MQLRIRVASLVIAALTIAGPASAQVVQSISGGLGGFFWPRGFDSRVNGDIWVEDLVPTAPQHPDLPFLGLAFEISDFKGANVFGEWTLGWGNHLEFGAGLNYYQRTVHSIYLDAVNELPDGTRIEIPQDLKLRMLPISGVVRLLAFRPGQFQPYIGGGVAAINFRYSEIGEFVDPSDGTVFPESYRKSGTAFGGLFLLGLKIPLGGDIYVITTEYRHQFGSGDLTGVDPAFPAPKIDLSGGYLNFGFQIRF